MNIELVLISFRSRVLLSGLMVTTIRSATSHDARKISECVIAAYSHYITRIGKPPQPMLHDYDVIIASSSVSVAERNDEIIGVVVYKKVDDHILLDNVAVLPSHQGEGVGSRLISFVEAEALRLGCGAIEFYTNELMAENIAIYSRRGYIESHRATEDGFNRIYMIKRLRGFPGA